MSSRDYEIRGRGPQVVNETEIESVGGLTRRIRALLKASIPPTWVRGEVSNLRTQTSGHIYFSLKDRDSTLSCVMFRGDGVRSGSAPVLRDGAQVVVFGEIDVYEPRGNYQLIVRVAIDDGRGRLQQEFERLKARLAAEGLFEPARKKKLPLLPAVIGFITSPTGAAVQDFMRILERRRWRGHLVILPVKVQGDGAAAEMVAALELAQRLAASETGPRFELLVIGRGGGSLEDLWAFNEEPLVRAIAACPIPVISAVGHEIDFTLSDFAADIRAETPSAAAELISSSWLDLLERVRQADEKLTGVMDDHVHDWRSRVEILRTQLLVTSPAARLEREHLRLDDCANRLGSAVRHILQARRQKMGSMAERLAQVGPRPTMARARERVRAMEARWLREVEVYRAKQRERLAHLGERLQAAGPDSVLKRGFVILWDDQRKPVTARDTLKPGQKISAQWHDGEAPLRAE